MGSDDAAMCTAFQVDLCFLVHNANLRLYIKY